MRLFEKFGSTLSLSFHQSPIVINDFIFRHLATENGHKTGRSSARTILTMPLDPQRNKYACKQKSDLATTHGITDLQGEEEDKDEGDAEHKDFELERQKEAKV